MLGGIHPTFRYTQVFSEAPWTDYIVRGDGEEIAVALLQSIEAGMHRKDRKRIWGIAYIDDDGQVVATPARPVIEDLDTLTPDGFQLDWDKYIYTPLNRRVAPYRMLRAVVLLTCRFCSQWKFWRKYRHRDPKKFVDEIETLVSDYKVGFMILADEEPTIFQKTFVALCEELIKRDLPLY